MMADRWKVFLVSGLGSGLAPFAPGTFGTLPAAVIYAFILHYLPAGPGRTLAILAVGVIASAVTVALGPWAEKHFGRKDPGSVVLDEWAGYLLTALLWPAHLWPDVLKTPILAALCVFVSFRVFDILKLPPARQLEKLPKGWGVLADDLASSLYAAVALHAACWAWAWSM
jgi:phosphatidylglycerophosphatase A